MSLGERGSLLVEYVLLLALVSLGLMYAIVLVGPALHDLYTVQRAVLMFPIL